MHSFFTDPFHVSQILGCAHVYPKSETRLIHRDRPSHGLVAICSGKIRYRFDHGTKLTVEAGDICYLPKFSNYDVEILAPAECIAVNFDLCETELTYPPFSLKPAQRNLYTAILKELRRIWKKRTAVSENQCCMLLYQLLLAVQRNAATQYVPSHIVTGVKKGAEYLRHHYARADLTVQEIADMLRISPEYFRKLFRTVYGTSPKQYMLSLRMEKAKEMLLSGEHTVLAIAEACGYESESYFCKEFKRMNGKTASEFIREQPLY